MGETEHGVGGFTGNPSAAFAVASTRGCCGNAQQSTPAPPDPDAGPCCGTAAEATAEGSCCGSTAKADAVASHQGCCR
ncbi:MAG TPA: hypothetical protein VFH03_12475 [Actinoplanes sp.]|nr:hypothetical protein [Actinoplanes sp.]